MKLLARFERTPGMDEPNLIRRGLLLLGVFALILVILYGRGIPFAPKGGDVITAEFTSAQNVSPGKTPVRVHGVLVGDVEKVSRRPGGRGVVIKMRIKQKGFTLKQDAQAHMLWRTLLGFNFYIDLDPGSSSAPDLDGATIPLKHTTTQVELDQVLAALKPASRAGIQTTLKEFDKGFADPDAAGGVIDNLPGAMKQIGPGIGALRGEQPGDLTAVVRGTSRVVGGLARAESDLGGLVDNADTTLGVTAARRADLGQILSDGPATMAQTRKTLANVRGTLDVLDPVAQQLRPGARVLDDASASLQKALVPLRPVLDDARPTLTALRPALTRLKATATTGVPLLTDLEPMFDRLNNVLLPFLKEKDPKTGISTYEAIGPVAATVSSSASLFDQNGYTQRFGAGTAVSERSAGFLPCSTNLSEGQANCDDLSRLFTRILGFAPTSSAKKGK
jgi:virulence factor Mce-like protein